MTMLLAAVASSIFGAQAQEGRALLPVSRQLPGEEDAGYDDLLSVAAVRASRIHGRGLILSRTVAKGDILGVGFYEFRRGNLSAAHFFPRGCDFRCDLTRCAIRAVNHARRPSARCHAVSVEPPLARYPDLAPVADAVVETSLVARRNLRRGDEITLDYGTLPWYMEQWV